jgi:hypothetical protein
MKCPRDQAIPDGKFLTVAIAQGIEFAAVKGDCP